MFFVSICAWCTICLYVCRCVVPLSVVFCSPTVFFFPLSFVLVVCEVSLWCLCGVSVVSLWSYWFPLQRFFCNRSWVCCSLAGVSFLVLVVQLWFFSGFWDCFKASES